MNTATRQIIVSIIANKPSKNITFPLTHHEQLQTLQRDYRQDEVAAVEVEVNHYRRSVGGVLHRFVTNTRFDTMGQFTAYAAWRYV